MYVLNGRRRRQPAALLACLLSTPFLYACSPPQQDGVVHIREGSKEFIQTETVSGARTDVAVSAPARVEFRDGAVSQLGAPLDGRVVKVNAQIGDRVAEGDPL